MGWALFTGVVVGGWLLLIAMVVLHEEKHGERVAQLLDDIDNGRL